MYLVVSYRKNNMIAHGIKSCTAEQTLDKENEAIIFINRDIIL